MEWTKKQKQVIESRDSDILVSAAAGSGKTAVLVERIIGRVCDASDPVDIDRILVVTFTKAAAREMKERIFRALETRVAQYPDDGHLLRQLSLIHNAHISTIDGFCQYLLRNYFHEIGLDPATRIADEGELVLLGNEVMEALLEERYESGDAAFLALTDAFAQRDRDDVVVDMVFSLHNEAMSYPYPVKWLSGLAEPYQDREGAARWLGLLTEHVGRVLAGLEQEASELLSELTFHGTEHPYVSAVEADLALIRALRACEGYEALYECFSGLQFATLSRKRLADEDKEERERLKNRRDAIKKELTQLKKELVSQPIEEIEGDLALCAPFVQTLLSLAMEYGSRFAKEKEARGIMDFSDLEHFALAVLVDEQTGERTPAARKLAEYFAEIMVDEYQDSNFLQELILSSLATKRDYFMVGDVKQSIYRFRQARPDIFMGKFHRYGVGREGETLIALDKNFRSRREVTDAVNAVFFSVMHEDMGGVEYSGDQKLTCGADYYPGQEGEESPFTTELLLSDATEAQAGEFPGKHEYEAAVIATRIRQLLREGVVSDVGSGTFRPVRLSDIAILHRSANAVGKTYQEVLKGYGIPAQIVSTTGYFSAIEVETMLALLRVLNNPAQDIALAAVMRSPMFAFSDEMLAAIRAAYPGEAFHRAVRLYESETGDERLSAFLSRLAGWRSQVGTVSLYELLSGILRETGYGAYVSALPGGDVRRRNIDKLLSLSVTYENTSYKGLFYFVRYIERLQKYEQDMGQAGALAGEEAVSILTIHKSKGLEYPIVFLAGCGQRFQSRMETLVLHPDLGVGLPAVDLERRTKKQTLYRTFLARQNRMEERGEELRVLYVAMTRAKEKLIVTGVTADAEKLWDGAETAEDGTLSFVRRLGASSYLAFLLPTAKRWPRLFSMRMVTAEELVVAETAEQLESGARFARLKRNVAEVAPEQRQAVTEELAFVYPHPFLTETKVKYSVSELKRRAMEEAFADTDTQNLFEQEKAESYVPLFISGKERVKSGAVRGTAVHRYLECFDFTCDKPWEHFRGQLDAMLADGRMTRDEAAVLPEREIVSFLRSPLAGRMGLAAKNGSLEKEAAFVMSGLPSQFLDGQEASEEEEPILVQGIIDVFFAEADGIVLVDYKTDRVKTGEELIRRYKKQMLLYADALTRTQEKLVQEILLYSFALDCSIIVCSDS